MLTTPDWIFAGVLCVALPLYSVWSYSRFRAQVADRDPQARTREYSSTLAMEWGLVLALGLFWIAQQRTLPELGLGLPGGIGFLIGVAITAVLIALQVLQSRSVLRNPDKQAEVRQQIGHLADLLPHTPRERTWFSALSVTAGICEEILYRGFLLWMLAALVGLPLAVVLSSVIFGLGHLYQGPVGAVKTAVIGLAMALLTVLSGSIWLAMVVHAVIDLTSGQITAASLSDPNSPEATAEL